VALSDLIQGYSNTQNVTKHTITNKSEQEKRREKWLDKASHASKPIKGCSWEVDWWGRLAWVFMTATHFSNSDDTHSQI